MNQLEQEYKCLKCSYTEEPEKVWYMNKHFLRCPNCGHEKFLSRITTTVNVEQTTVFLQKEENIIKY